MIYQRSISSFVLVAALLFLTACSAPAPASPTPGPVTATVIRSPAVQATATRHPTHTPAAATSAPTPVPLLSGEPASYLPEVSDLPPEVVLQEASSGTNEEISQQFDNPADVLERLESWGRLSNLMQLYAPKSGCAAPELREIYLQVVLYETPEGAAQALEWYLERSQEKSAQTEVSTAVGETGYILQHDETSGCTPPGPLSVVSIGFRRSNALGFVDVSRVANAIQDPNMETLALRLAQIIDYHFYTGLQPGEAPK